MSEQVTVSVRNLVEFILRSGDIDNSRGFKDPDAMQEGSRIHRKIQKAMPSGYAAEVSLKTEIPLEDGEKVLMLTVEGRADGIWLRDEASGEVLIDEIKSMYLDVSHIKEPVPVHQAQAKCYAYIYAEQHDLDSIGVQMTYVNIETEAVKRFEEFFTKESLVNGSLKGFFDLDLDGFNFVFNLNMIGTLLPTQEFAKRIFQMVILGERLV